MKSKSDQDIELKDQSKQVEDDEQYDSITVPPDGGYGWVVLIACFVSDYQLFN